MTDSPEALEQILTGIRSGGFMFRPGPKEKIQAAHRYLQEKSKIPLLLAANLEYGGSGIATDGTVFTNPM
ncbi:hypothetical protein [Paenibacillus tyrfis]|uniref:hypothetical protein n=1 Tax=Paenibacillus tyrfis TaxID=1501230 RepID=UPI00209D4BDD|nr:hypothetical protein [Paenibacillus tyrfis]MCP1306304.1 hypothetical protein [Paenibacillus tyrfis]